MEAGSFETFNAEQLFMRRLLDENETGKVPDGLDCNATKRHTHPLNSLSPLRRLPVLLHLPRACAFLTRSLSPGITVAHAPSQPRTNAQAGCGRSLELRSKMAGAASAALSRSPSVESMLSGGGSKKRDSLGAAAAPPPIVKDVGEIYSRILDHRPVVQGEIRYFIKEFEEKRGLREMRVLEKLKNTVFEANDQTLPKCEQVMSGNLNEALRRLQIANEMINRLQQREQENKQYQTEKLMAGEAQRRALWEEFLKEQRSIEVVVDEEHTKAMERLKEQYVAMGKDLAKYAV